MDRIHSDSKFILDPEIQCPRRLGLSMAPLIKAEMLSVMDKNHLESVQEVISQRERTVK